MEVRVKDVIVNVDKKMDNQTKRFVELMAMAIEIGTDDDEIQLLTVVGLSSILPHIAKRMLGGKDGK